MSYPTPMDEQDRLAVLRRYDLLGRPPEPDLEDFTAIAREMCGTPIALVTLLDETRQWFHCAEGLSGPGTPREHSFCQYALRGDDILEIPDSLLDPRTRDNPLVHGEPHIRFYAGAPLRVPEGAVLGTLCVIDRVPRALGEAQRRLLQALARQVVHRLVARRERSAQERSDALLRMAGRLGRLGGWTVDLPSGRHEWTDETRAIHEVAPGDQFDLERLLAFYPEGPRYLVQSAVEACAARGESFDLEAPFISARGRNRWVRAIGEAVRGPDGSIVRIQGAVQDITERKEAEASLAASEARFRQLAEAMPHFVWTATPEGEVDFVNEMFVTYAGLEQEPSPSSRWATAVHPDDLPPTLETWAKALSSGQPYFTRFRILRARDRTYRWFQVMARPIREGGRIVKWFGAGMDVHERHELEEQLRRAQRMESLGTLAGGIAHDLNNLLAPIRLGVDVLRERVDAPELRPILRTLGTSVVRGAELVQRVLTYARGGEGDLVPLDLKRVVVEAHQLVRDSLPAGMALEVEFATDRPRVRGDVGQLEQVLVNLILNARDARPVDGRIRIRLEQVDDGRRIPGHAPTGRNEGPHVVVLVRDSGGGIAPEHFDRIFDPFFTTKEVGRGSGLGLATSLGIVRGHGGFFTLESEVGRGSTFRVCLPALGDATAAPAPDVAPTSAPAPAAPRSVLVVEDEEPLREIASAILASAGHRVRTAADGAEALAILARERHSIDLVFTDLRMPRLDGAALIADLIRRDPGLPVIAASGFHHEDQLTPELRAHLRTFLPKPYSARALLDAVARA